jgi:hypothetical protein
MAPGSKGFIYVVAVNQNGRQGDQTPVWAVAELPRPTAAGIVGGRRGNGISFSWLG